jgi:hypothetical protein
MVWGLLLVVALAWVVWGLLRVSALACPAVPPLVALAA